MTSSWGADSSTSGPCSRFSGSLGLVALAVSMLAWTGAAHGADTSAATSADGSLQSLQQVVVTSTPIPGQTINVDKIPGTVQILTSGDISLQGSPSLTTALSANLSSVNINDNTDDPFQPDILYRGFEASPVLGTPQGLAVYQNGVRINEAFGDTVNWDLFPSVAINNVELVSSSPLYGLNALGGAISMTMKNGFTYRGGDLELSGGSFANRSVVAEYGMHSGRFGFYAAGKALDSAGWRDFSGDKIRSLFAVWSFHARRVSLDLSYTHADDVLDGQGPAPVQELAVSRALTFTGPQNNVNTLNFFTLNASLNLTRDWSMQGVAYYRAFAQSISNGNTTNYTACTNQAGILCQPDGVSPLTNVGGNPLPDVSLGGAVPIGENDFELNRSWGRGVSLQITNDARLFGHGNELAVGAALDYASTAYFSGAQIGALGAERNVLPSSLYVFTPENSAAAIANGDPVPVSVDSVNQNVGTYLTDTFDVTHDLSVTASGRYNITHIDLVDQLGPNLTGTNRFVHFNPSFGATYKILTTMTLYGGFSVNTRTPTASEIECSDPLTPCLLPTSLAGDPPLKQVISHTTELGLRGSAPQFLGGTGLLAWNVDVFRTLLHNDIYGVATSLSQGYFQNVGDTRRQGVEAGLNYRTDRWNAFVNYSFVQATFESTFFVPSPSNPFRNASGDILVKPGDVLPGIPQNRVKLGFNYDVVSTWSVGTIVNVVSSFYYGGDQANLLAPIPGYTVVDLYSTYRPQRHLELFVSITNLFDRQYATYGLLSNPTGVGAPGIPVNAVTNGPGVNNRFLSPAAPLEIFGGARLML